jgi:tRNA nucleotidyltransferase (CCA-adding enzyme)
LSFTPSPKVKRIISLLYEGGASECIFVGGFVRDILLGLSSKDVDIEVYGLTYKRILRILRHHFNVNLVGQSFGTIKVDNEIDISIPRSESKSGVGHKGFDISCNPNLDLYSAFSRRDFTVNAIGLRVDNSVYDPFGGVQDIERKILRAPTEAFCDDPLRVLRGMQFAARFGFKMEPKTVEYCKRVSDEFVTLSVERVWGEWLKWGLKGVMPSLGLFLLQETEWVQHFPEIANLINVCSSRFKIRKVEHGSATTWSDCSRAKPTANTGSGITKNQQPKSANKIDSNNNEDLFTNTARVCDIAVKIADEFNFSEEERLELVFAALCHNFNKTDFNKTNFDKTESDAAVKNLSARSDRKISGTISNLKFDAIFSASCSSSLRLTRQFLERLKPPLRLVDKILSVVGEELTDEFVSGECVIGDDVLRRLAVRLEPSSIRIWAALCRAIILTNGNTELIPQVDECESRSMELGVFRNKPKPILQGRDLIARGVKAGREMGTILDNAYEAQLDGVFDNIEDAINWYAHHN